MKIAILTQALGFNFGGILQAFALQKALSNLGHEAVTVNTPRKQTGGKEKVKSVVKRLIMTYFQGKPVKIRAWPNRREKQIISQNTSRFIKEHIQLTELIDSPDKFQNLNKQRFQAFIVGSDQVWRPKYSPWLPGFFLAFLSEKDPARRIAYAASFGVDHWEYTPEQTNSFALLAKKFHAISVREDSAIELCKKHLGVNAVHLVDPTLLLPKEEYIKLIEKDGVEPTDGKLMAYILDKSEEKKKILEKASTALGLKSFFVMPSKRFDEPGRKKVTECVFPPVTAWLRGFMDAEYVVTDSFHGVVFSIIFNKPFIALGNQRRGLARFTSLLKMFDLEERLILSPENLTTTLLTKPIDWEKVNAEVNARKQEAIQFLTNALGH